MNKEGIKKMVLGGHLLFIVLAIVVVLGAALFFMSVARRSGDRLPEQETVDLGTGVSDEDRAAMLKSLEGDGVKLPPPSEAEKEAMVRSLEAGTPVKREVSDEERARMLESLRN